MLTNAFFQLTARSPAARRAAFRMLFEYLARAHRDALTWTQMNYGYAGAAAGGHTVALDAAEETERYCHQLYHRVVSGFDLAGRDVVEVSCGRGGGAAFLHRKFKPRTMTGIDIAHAAVDFCRRVHRDPGLRYLQGDAEDLPLFDGSADALVNVEASFCYADIERFFSEVRRVLRPGGLFLYTDLRRREEVAGLEVSLRRSGLDLLECEDITGNVLRALALDARRRVSVVEVNVPWFARHAWRTFAGAPGTRIPSLLGDGRMRYLRYVLRKGAGDEAWPACASAGPNAEILAA